MQSMNFNVSYLQKIVVLFLKFLVLGTLVFAINGCGNKFTKPNGMYCAEVKYKNPKTNTEKYYTLNIDINENQLTHIYWKNGGWLLDENFEPTDFDENGVCKLTNSYKKFITVTLIGNKCLKTDELLVAKDIENLFCISCGEEKLPQDKTCKLCNKKFNEDIKVNKCIVCGRTINSISSSHKCEYCLENDFINEGE